MFFKKKEKKKKMLRQTADILPFLYIDEDEGYIKTKDGYMDILQIETTDLHSMNGKELQMYLISQTMFLRSFTDSYKEVIMNFPSNCSSQRAYWLKKREGITDPVRLSFIDRKLYEFDFLERERTNREFFIFLFSDSVESLNSQKNQVARSLNQSFPVRKINMQKKQDILFILNNQNTKLIK